MSCFFSGTDSQELHDNAPNHNYYLSLIVNFAKSKDGYVGYTDWCAKIAFVGEEESKGCITQKYKGTDGSIIEIKDEIDTKEDVLYTIDMDIELYERELAVSDEFIGRVESLNSTKGRKYATQFNNAANNQTEYANWKKESSYKKGKQLEIENFPTGAGTGTGNNTSGTSAIPQTQVKVSFNKESIEEFCNKIVSICTEPTGTFLGTLYIINQSLADIEDGDVLTEAEKDFYLEGVCTSFEEIFIDHFKVSSSPASRELVIGKMEECMEIHYQAYPISEDIIEELKLYFEII